MLAYVRTGESASQAPSRMAIGTMRSTSPGGSGTTNTENMSLFQLNSSVVPNTSLSS